MIPRAVSKNNERQTGEALIKLRNCLSPATNVCIVREYTCVGNTCVAASLGLQTALGLALHDIFAHSSNDLHFTCTCSTSCLIRLDPFNSEAT